MSDELREQLAQALAGAAPLPVAEGAEWEGLPPAQRDEYHRLADAALAVIGPALNRAQRDRDKYADVMRALYYPDRELRAVVGTYAILATRDSKGCNEVGRSALRYAARMLMQRLGGYDQDEAVAAALEAVASDAAVAAALATQHPDGQQIGAASMRRALAAAAQALRTGGQA